MVLTQAGVGLDSVDYDPETGRYRSTFDGSTVPPSLALVATLSTAMDADPIDIDPLYESVDPDAIDTLLEAPVPSTEPVTVSLFLEYFDVTISSTGVVHVEPLADGGDDSGITPQRPT